MINKLRINKIGLLAHSSAKYVFQNVQFICIKTGQIYYLCAR